MTSDSVTYNNMTPLELAAEKKREIDAYNRSTLAPIHVAFVNNFFTHNMDIQISAESVGISVRTAHTWLEAGHPVAEYIAKRLEKWSNEVDITMEEIILGLKAEATRITSNKTDTQAARVAAWDKLARIKGAYDKNKKKDRPMVAVQININGNGEVDGSIEHS